jgi:hypothetical protein
VIWRVYRLPGSRKIWHIDNGPDTQILNVLGVQFDDQTKSVDIGCGVPRAWLQLEHSELHVINGVAIFSYPLAEVLEKLKLEEIGEASEPHHS